MSELKFYFLNDLEKHIHDLKMLVMGEIMYVQSQNHHKRKLNSIDFFKHLNNRDYSFDLTDFMEFPLNELEKEIIHNLTLSDKHFTTYLLGYFNDLKRTQELIDRLIFLVSENLKIKPEDLRDRQYYWINKISEIERLNKIEILLLKYLNSIDKKDDPEPMTKETSVIKIERLDIIKEDLRRFTNNIFSLMMYIEDFAEDVRHGKYNDILYTHQLQSKFPQISFPYGEHNLSFEDVELLEVEIVENLSNLPDSKFYLDYLSRLINNEIKEAKKTKGELLIAVRNLSKFTNADGLTEDYYDLLKHSDRFIERIEDIISNCTNFANLKPTEKVNLQSQPETPPPLAKIKLQKDKLTDLVELIFALDKSEIFLNPDTGKKLNQNELILIFEQLTGEKIVSQFGKLKNSRWDEKSYTFQDVPKLSEKTFTLELFRIVQHQITEYIKNKNK